MTYDNPGRNISEFKKRMIMVFYYFIHSFFPLGFILLWGGYYFGSEFNQQENT